MRGLRLLRAPAVLLGCLCALLFLGGTPASAHTALKDATPGPGAKVAPGVDVVALTFGRLKSGTTPTIGLTGPDGATVPVGRPLVVDDSATCAAVASLSAGVHTLSYTVTSADGDTQSSAFQFEVADGAENAATPSACRELSLPAPGAGGESDTILGLGRTTALVVFSVVGVVAVGGGVLAVRTMRGAKPPERRRVTM
ncbi:copper resistance protein CopC [Streptomyces ferrugineus]|uniref:Copper resistance protein CopC n=1 Tax=Streptomyces ferrugineus TaxID=1413221 RepID=A0A7M2SE20_9ACTN|nr:copper resistance CopC family protein [Streptomyces ferrugineus]QOV34580.1 copper resistance protein CopC [Streptomyces ferrugineus]